MKPGSRMIALALASAAIATASTDVDSLLVRLRARSLAKVPTNSDTLLKWIDAQAADGLWPDIDYRDTARGSWKPVAHVHRLQALALQVGRSGPALRGRDLRPALRLGFDGYIAHRYTGVSSCTDRSSARPAPPPCPIHSANWWWNDIGEGGPWSEALLLLHGSFPDSTLERWSRRMSSTLVNRWSKPAGQITDGANLFWEGEAVLRKGAVLGDAHLVDSTLRLFRAGGLLVDSTDGPHRDGSFFQHGAVYDGGYGAAYLGSVSYWITLTEGLPSLEWTAPQRRILVDQIVDGHAPMSLAGVYDPPTFGREIARNTSHGAATAARFAQQAQGPAWKGYRTDELAAAQRFLAGGVWPWPARTTRIYWSADYAVHHGRDWMVSWRFPGVHSVGTEQMNGENLKGWFLPFGAHWIRRGPQESTLFPLMDWARVPGVTCDQVDTFPGFYATTGQQTNRGTTAFAGGASSGTTAALGWDQDLSGIRGAKAVFLVPEGLIALGAGFSFRKEKRVGTSVDQRMARGPLWWSDGSRATTVTDSVQTVSARWAWHDSIGYWFPVAESLSLRRATRTGSWRDLATNGDRTGLRGEVASLWIAHGKQASAERFAYGIFPSMSRDSLASWSAASPIAILSNSPAVQAVARASAGWTAVVFRDADSLVSGGIRLAVDRPAALVVQETRDSVLVWAASPTRGEGILRVQIGRNLSGATLAGASGSALRIALPTGPSAGSTVSVALAKAGGPTAVPHRGVGAPLARITDGLLRSDDPGALLIDLHGHLIPAIGSAGAGTTWDLRDRPFSTCILVEHGAPRLVIAP